MSQYSKKLSNSPVITSGDQRMHQVNNIIASENGSVTVQQQLINGYSIEQHTQALKDKEAQVRADLERAHAAEQALLNIQLDAIKAELDNIHVSYQKRISDLEAQIKNLEKYQSLVSAGDYDRAKEALLLGNFSLAESLYSNVEDQATAFAADAALQRGLIADRELRWKDALKHFKKASALAPENDDYAYELAEMSTRIGLYLDAKNVYLERLKRIEGSDSTEDLIKLAFFSEGLGKVYRIIGKFDDALALYRKCLELCEKVLGKTHIALATTYSDYAGLQSDLGNYSDAERLFKESLKIYDLNGRSDSSYTAVVKANLANLYQKTWRLDEAELLFTETIPVMQKCFGHDHPNLAPVYNNLAQSYFNQLKFNEAEKYYNAAFLIYQKIHSSEHPDMIMVNLNLAGVYREQGKFNESKSLYERVIRDLKLHFGEVHPTLATAYNNFSILFTKHGMYAEAEAVMKKSIEIGINSVGKYHPDMIERYEGLALIYQFQGNIPEATKHFQLAEEIKRKKK